MSFRAILHRDTATYSLLGLTRQPTSIIYDIHPAAFVSYLTNKRAEYDYTHSLFCYYTQDTVQKPWKLKNIVCHIKNSTFILKLATVSPSIYLMCFSEAPLLNTKFYYRSKFSQVTGRCLYVCLSAHTCVCVSINRYLSVYLSF